MPSRDIYKQNTRFCNFIRKYGLSKPISGREEGPAG